MRRRILIHHSVITPPSMKSVHDVILRIFDEWGDRAELIMIYKSMDKTLKIHFNMISADTDMYEYKMNKIIYQKSVIDIITLFTDGILSLGVDLKGKFLLLCKIKEI